MALQKTDRCLVVVTDDVFALPATVALRSARRNCDASRTKAVVIDCGISKEGQARMRQAWPGVTLKELDPAHVAPFATDRAAAAMARLALEHYVELEQGRVLYLDSDVLVRSSLEPLFRADLRGFLLGAVPATGRPIMGLDPYDEEVAWQGTEYAAGGAAPGGIVFNSGVLLIDIAAWRDADLLRRSQVLGSRFPVADQRLLNAMLSRDWYPLSSTWNSKEPGATIYHFAANPRPWEASYYRNPIWLEYLSEADAIGWAISRPRLLPLRVKIRSLASKLRHMLAA